MTVSTISGFTLAAARAALEATVCKSQAVVLTNLPPYVPNGVRLAPTINTPKINKKKLVDIGHKFDIFIKYHVI